MRKIKTIIMVLALTMFSVQVASAQWVISGTVSGCNLCHGGDAADVTITLSGNADAVTVTTGDGTYSFTGVANGSYTVVPTLAPDLPPMGLVFNPASRQVDVEDDNEPAINFAAEIPCVPETECSAGSECGTEPDGCGGTIDCGECDAGDSCEVNVCVPSCTPASTCTEGSECGTEPDGCGGTIDCGTCDVGDSCEVNVCVPGCIPDEECSAGSECGTEPDGCGGTIDCGECDSDESCVANICEETPDIDCACDDDWKNHGQYVRCVAQDAGDLVDAGLISEAEKDEIVGDAGKSDCGKK